MRVFSRNIWNNCSVFTKNLTVCSMLRIVMYLAIQQGQSLLHTNNSNHLDSRAVSWNTNLRKKSLGYTKLAKRSD
jgi:hypothetical protein